MAKYYKCDLCKKEVTSENRSLFKITGIEDLCSECRLFLRMCMDLMTMKKGGGTFKQEVIKAHEQVFKAFHSKLKKPPKSESKK